MQGSNYPIDDHEGERSVTLMINGIKLANEHVMFSYADDIA
jgi:hypothetical protein